MAEAPQAAQLDESQVTHREIDVGEVRLHCAESGAGPLVILLHGFPEFWYSWRYQIPALVEAGYHVVAPDMRGYNLSGKPRGVRAYDASRLADDVAGLARALGAERAIVVGHDWGAAVAWSFAMRHPELLDRLVILNVPHPMRMFQGLRTWRQARKSWYMFFFQLPWLPEWAMRRRGYSWLHRMFRADPVRKGAFSDSDIERYVEAAARPGALTGAINYYRAAFRRSPRRTRADLATIERPVLVIWGTHDRYLGRELAEPDPRWVPDVRVEYLPDASHWVQVDRPDRVNALMLEFLGPAPPAEAG